MNGDKNGVDLPHVGQIIIDKTAKCLHLKNYEFKLLEKLGKGDNFLGEIHYANISGVNANGENENHKLVVKFSHKNVHLRELFPLNILYQREAFAYEIFLPTIDQFQKERNVPKTDHFKFAQCYATDIRNMSELLVFENLTVKEFMMYDRLKPLDYKHTTLIIKNIAKFHALSFAIKDRKPEIYEIAKKYKFYLSDFGDSFVENVTKSKDRAAANIINSDHRKRFEKFGENIHREIVDSLDIEDNNENPYNVLCHGDCWNNNFLFRYEESDPVEVIMVDWQIMRYASPISDLSYFLYTGTDKAFRDKHLEEIYELYYQTLQDHLGKLDVDVDKCYPKHVFRQQIKQKSVTGLIWAFLILPITLNTREDSFDLNDVMDKVKVDEEFDLQYSSLCKARLNEVVSDFVDMGII